MRKIVPYLVGAFVGFLASSYMFIFKGYQVEYFNPGSAAWYEAIKTGRIPPQPELVETEIRSNGYILEVYGTINNPRNTPLMNQKISADLFDSSDSFFHKCENWVAVVPVSSSYNFKFHCANLSDFGEGKFSHAKIYLDS